MRIRLCVFLLVAFTSLIFGQASDGNIVGTVLDASGSAVPSARVELMNVGTAVKSTATTDSTGTYRLSNLLVGNYSLTVSASGFTTRALKDLNVDLNKTTTANVTLEIGSVATAVDVVAAAALIDTTTAQVSNNYEARMAADLPSAANTGGVLNLALLGAGVSSSGC